MRCAQRTAIAAVYGFSGCTDGTVLAQTVQALAPEPQPATAGYASIAPREKAVSPEPAVAESREQKIARLRETAFGRTGNGQFREPSAQTREAARQALFLLHDDSKPLAYLPSTPAVIGAALVAPSNVATNANPQADYRQIGAASTSDSGPLNKPSYNDNGQQRPTRAQSSDVPLMAMAVGSGQTTVPFVPGGIEYENTLGPVEAPPSPIPAPGATETPTDQVTSQNQIATSLTQSPAVQDVEVQHRSEVSFDPHVAGYKWGQVYADMDGGFWQPARIDLDTMLSKIDPGMIQSLTVIPGPYGVRYGPGLAFIDMSLVPTPRHDQFESELDTTFNIRSNGGQLYDRETYSGGGADWGFRGSFGDKLGSDYRSGDGTPIPGNYHATDEFAQLGYDIDKYQKLTFLYQRLDENNVDNPGEVFDTAYLGATAFTPAMRTMTPRRSGAT